MDKRLKSSHEVDQETNGLILDIKAALGLIIKGELDTEPGQNSLVY